MHQDMPQVDPAPPPLGVPESRPVAPRMVHRLTALGEVLLCSSVPTQLVIGAGLGLAGLSPLNQSGQLSLVFVVALALLDTTALVALMVLLMRAHGESAHALWIGRRPVLREIRIGLALIPGVFVAVLVLVNGLRVAAPWLRNVAVNPLEQLAGGSPMEAAAFAFIAIVAGGVREEMQRAFLLDRFERHLGGVVVGVVVLSLAFGLGHFLQGRDAVVTTAVLGAFWAILYVRRRSSVAAVVSHAGFNSLEILRVATLGALVRAS